MTTAPEQVRRAKLVENSFLVIAGVLACAPLYYQLPRWANGLDPTYVHPSWLERARFPLVLYMEAVHPLIWIAVIVSVFLRMCRNYGWRLRR